MKASLPDFTSSTILVFQLGCAGQECTTAGSAERHHMVIDLRDPDEVKEDFRRHVQSLSSLDDLRSRLRSMDPDFYGNAERAREERYRELMDEVRIGALSRVYVERIHRRMSQEELAEKIGSHQPNVSRIENPGHQIHPSTAKRIAAVFEMDYRELL